jgi:multidrug efflux pump
MNIAGFFIDRPIFASVLSILTVIGGLITVNALPVSEYPEVVPPSVVVAAAYPGASASVISETVATPLEEQINGVENMLYMSSQATTDGRLSITITFKLGTDADLAQQLVQNRVSQALPRLPDIVRTIGVTTVKSAPDLTMVVHLISPNQRYDTTYLRNYAVLNIKDNLSRIPGVGQIMAFGGGDYAMRLWLNPNKIAALDMTASDVVMAVREQNIQVAAGAIGAPPNMDTLVLQLPIKAKGRLTSVAEFENIILKTSQTGGIIRLKDVARVQLDAADYAMRSLLDNNPASALAIFQMPGSNAIEISNNVRAAMEELKERFPEDMQYRIVYDPTVFVRDSIKEVIKTLMEAILLVVIVVIVFLQTWRASIVPLIAVPVSIIGTLGFMYLFGFSINALSLFGMVLAIGIVVDDAIVVIENVERNIRNGLDTRAATIQAMSEVTGPIIATFLVLAAVFIPVANISGLSGQFYKQFALTITISVLISTFNSLTLSPALAKILLQPHDAKPDMLSRGINSVLGGFFDLFNRGFERFVHFYTRGVRRLVTRAKTPSLLLYAGLIAAAIVIFSIVPKGFVPAQDKKYLIGFAQLQDGATIDRTDRIIHKMSDIIMKEPGVASAVGFPGLSIAGFSASSSAGIVFVTLKEFDEREGPELSAGAIAGNLNQKFATIPGAFIAIFPPPPVMGLGTIGGFKLEIQDRGDQGEEALNAVTQAVIGKSYQNPVLANVFSGYKINVPQLQADLDREKAKQMGLNIADIYQTMQIYLGSLYINDFNQFGRTYQVIAQADGMFRDKPEDIAQLKVRNVQGEMVPLGSVVRVTESYGPEISSRYNAYRSADINAGPAPGYSSAEAEGAMLKILKETLPKGFTFEWTDLKYQEILAGNTMVYVLPLCVFLVFLVLAAQYESLVLPMAVIMIVPMSLLCAITGVWLTGGDNNIFTQISFIVLVGLACKNAILIIEFARELELQGEQIIEAAIEAARLRLRPILMTSFAAAFGVLPLVLSTGAGAEMRHAMGVAMFYGILGVTFFGVFLTPVFYVTLRLLSGGRPLTSHGTHTPILHHPHDESSHEAH